MEISCEKSKIGPKVYNTVYSQVVTQTGTDATQRDLTWVIGREPVRSLSCGRRRKKQVGKCLI